ncbi:MAG TPA: CHASE2 domain-containing protein [Myxococcota bacterium]|nr:CHASE2 domain-containing protein [Myxococcota bacterium]
MRGLGELLQAVVAAEDAEDSVRHETALGQLHRALREALPEDPLMAASLLPHVLDEGIREELERRALQATPLRARAIALVVDRRGEGHQVEVVVDLSAGGRGVWTTQGAAQETLLGAQVAVAAALGDEARRFGVRWQLSEAQRVRGASLGLAIAAATRAAREGVRIPRDVGFTGAVELDGRVAKVAGIPAKLRAAEGLRQVVLPREGAPEHELARPVATLEAALAPLFPRAAPPRRLPWQWVLVLVAPLLALSSALDFLELALRPAVVSLLHGTLEAEETVLIALPADVDRRELRAEYPQLLSELQEAGATAVVLDVLLLAETEHDAALSEALTGLEVPVIAPLRVDGETVSRPVIDGLVVGVAEFERDVLFGKVRRAPVEMSVEEGSAWHLAVLGLGAHLNAEPVVREGQLEVGVTRNPLSGGRLHLPPVGPSPELNWSGPYGGAAGKVVFIGDLSGRGDRLRTSLGSRQGVELHAALLESLARQRALRLGRPLWDALAALIAGLGTALVARRLPGWARPLGGLVGIAVLAVLVGVAAAGTVPAFLPTVIATGIGLLVARMLR